MPDRAKIEQFVGRATKDPESVKYDKNGKSGEIVKFGLAFSDGYDDDSKTTYLDIAVFNEGQQDLVMGPADANGRRSGGQVYKGAAVAVEGTVKQNGQYNPSVAVTRIGLVQWFPRTKSAPRTDPVVTQMAQSGELAMAANTGDDTDF